MILGSWGKSFVNLAGGATATKHELFHYSCNAVLTQLCTCPHVYQRNMNEKTVNIVDFCHVSFLLPKKDAAQLLSFQKSF